MPSYPAAAVAAEDAEEGELLEEGELPCEDAEEQSPSGACRLEKEVRRSRAPASEEERGRRSSNLQASSSRYSGSSRRSPGDERSKLTLCVSVEHAVKQLSSTCDSLRSAIKRLDRLAAMCREQKAECDARGAELRHGNGQVLSHRAAGRADEAHAPGKALPDELGRSVALRVCIDAFPECHAQSKLIMKGLRSVNVVCSTSRSVTQNLDVAVALFRTAMNYRHHVFSKDAVTELESMVRTSRLLRTLIESKPAAKSLPAPEAGLAGRKTRLEQQQPASSSQPQPGASKRPKRESASDKATQRGGLPPPRTAGAEQLSAPPGPESEALAPAPSSAEQPRPPPPPPPPPPPLLPVPQAQPPAWAPASSQAVDMQWEQQQQQQPTGARDGLPPPVEHAFASAGLFVAPSDIPPHLQHLHVPRYRHPQAQQPENGAQHDGPGQSSNARAHEGSSYAQQQQQQQQQQPLLGHAQGPSAQLHSNGSSVDWRGKQQQSLLDSSQHRPLQELPPPPAQLPLPPPPLPATTTSRHAQTAAVPQVEVLRLSEYGGQSLRGFRLQAVGQGSAPPAIPAVTSTPAVPSWANLPPAAPRHQQETQALPPPPPQALPPPPALPAWGPAPAAPALLHPHAAGSWAPQEVNPNPEAQALPPPQPPSHAERAQVREQPSGSWVSSVRAAASHHANGPSLSAAGQPEAEKGASTTEAATVVCDEADRALRLKGIANSSSRPRVRPNRFAMLSSTADLPPSSSPLRLKGEELGLRPAVDQGLDEERLGSTAGLDEASVIPDQPLVSPLPTPSPPSAVPSPSSSPSSSPLKGKALHAVLPALQPQVQRRSSPPLAQSPTTAADVQSLLAASRLCLVLDLDHTLLNSALFSEVTEASVETLLQQRLADEAAKAAAALGESAQPAYRELFRQERLGMWTKLRPGVQEFLSRASHKFELWIHTNGNRSYAEAMAQLLDPEGALFGGRIIAQGTSGGDADVPNAMQAKRFASGLEGREPVAVVLDDSSAVWPNDLRNLLVVERYMYFPASRRKFGLPGKALLEVNRDECSERGMLMTASSVLDRIHANVFAKLEQQPQALRALGPSQDGDELQPWDVRAVMEEERRAVLLGCHLVFSRVIPLEQEPQQHALWRMAERFGATCSSRCSDATTHVVANSHGTEKTFWAQKHNRHVVGKSWLECSCLFWCRAAETRFPVPHSVPRPAAL